MPTSFPRSRVEFIALIASIMMIVAFAIDAMLPALPAIGEALGVTMENRRSLVITVFMAGFGVSQFFVGTLSDRYGRRGLMLASLIGYALCSLAAATAPSFALLLSARAAQGAAAAGARVLATSVVRDRFEGRDMAQVMSLATMVFMAAPILAPTMGTLVLMVAPWRWIFVVLALLGATIWLWVLLRLPESLARGDRRDITPTKIITGARIVLSDRASVGYTVGITCMSCVVMGFLTSVQPIFADIFRHPEWLPGGFAVMAGTMATASLVNSRIVMRWGMRRIGHAALFGLTAIAAMHAAVALTGHENIITFVALQSVMMACFSLTTANFSAMAMENVGAVAGTASSLQGSFSTIVGALVGGLIGQSFNGTTAPLYVGVTLAGLTALVAVFIAERGRFFVARHESVVSAA